MNFLSVLDDHVDLIILPILMSNCVKIRYLIWKEELWYIKETSYQNTWTAGFDARDFLFGLTQIWLRIGHVTADVLDSSPYLLLLITNLLRERPIGNTEHRCVTQVYESSKENIIDDIFFISLLQYDSFNCSRIFRRVAAA